MSIENFFGYFYSRRAWIARELNMTRMQILQNFLPSNM